MENAVTPEQLEQFKAELRKEMVDTVRKALRKHKSVADNKWIVPGLLSAGVALLLFLLAQVYQTQGQLGTHSAAVEKHFGELEATMEKRFGELDARMEKRFGEVNVQLTKLDEIQRTLECLRQRK